MEIGYIYAFGAAVCWGLIYTIYGKILSTASPLPLLFVTSVIYTIALIPYALLNTDAVRIVVTSGKLNVFLIILVTLLSIPAGYLIYLSIKTLDASTASMIEIAYPFFVVLFSFILFRSVPNLYFFLGGLLIFIGSVIIIKFA